MSDQTLSPEASELEALLNSTETAAVLDAVLGSTRSGAFIARASDGKILRISDVGAQLIGRRRHELEGKTLSELYEFVPAYDSTGRRLSLQERPIARALAGETVTGFELWVETPEGERIPCECNAAPIRPRGVLIGAISSIADLRRHKALERELREAAGQSEALYRELTHRVKNHLQIMTTLATLSARNPDMSAKDLSEQMKGQMRTLAAVYRGMDRAEAGARMEAAPFVEEVCRPYASDGVKVETSVTPADLTLTSEQAGPVGMLVNEAVSNSCKHAFPDRGGHIQVSLTRPEPGRMRLEVADDGVGWGSTDPNEPSHGLDLMRLFAKQLHGELELSVHRLGGALVAADMPEVVD